MGYNDNPVPSNVDAEKIILASVIRDTSFIYQVCETLSSRDFHNPTHKMIFEGMALLLKSSTGHLVINPITIIEAIKKLGKNPDVFGGTSSIVNLVYGVPKLTDISGELKTVKELSDKRHALEILGNATKDIYDAQKPLIEVKTSLENELSLFDVSDDRMPKDSNEVADSVLEIFNEWESAEDESKFSVKSSLPELNSLLKFKGYSFGDLVLIGARPSMGKTALLLQELKVASLQGYPSLFCTYEMTKESLFMRMLPSMVGISNKNINPYVYRRNEQMRIQCKAALEKLRSLPLHYDPINKNVYELEAMILSFIKKKGIKVIGLDYLQLMEITGGYNRLDQEYAAILRMLKKIAHNEGVLIILLVQLNRSPEQNNTRPEMSDIRECGNAEQDADVVSFLYNPMGKVQKLGPNARKAAEPQTAINIRNVLSYEEIIKIYVAKQRNGPAGDFAQIEAVFDKNYQRIMTSELFSIDDLKKMEE